MDKTTTDQEPVAEPAASPSVAQPQTEAEFTASLDAALAEQQRVDRIREPEPEPEPERDYSTVVDTALELGIPLATATPDKFGDIDLQDEAAIRERLVYLKEHNENVRELQQAIEQQPGLEYAQEFRNEQALEFSRAVLEDGSTSDAFTAASIIQEQHPEAFDQYLAEWTEVDPAAAHNWSSQHPPINWQERADERAWQVEELERDAEQAQLDERQREITASFQERITELEADPTANRYLDSALHMIGMQAGTDPNFGVQSPEEAKALLDASVKTARELSRASSEADSIAKWLAPLDEKLELQRALHEEQVTGFFNKRSRDEIMEQTRYEQLNFRGPPTPAKEQDAAFLSGFDSYVEEKHLNERHDLDLPKHISDRIEEQRKTRLRAKGWRV